MIERRNSDFLVGTTVLTAAALVIVATLWLKQSGIASSIFLPAVAAAQPTIPTRSLGEIIATGRDSLQSPFLVRGLSNGSLLLNEVRRFRVTFLDSTLTYIRTAVDSSGTYSLYSESLIAYPGDTTLVPEWSSRTMLVVGPEGKVARTMAFPNATMTPTHFAATSSHNPQGDSNGRLIYQGVLFPQPVPQGSQTTYPVRMVLPSDTAPLLRANFETRQTDTIDYLRLNRRNPLREVSRSKNGNLLYHTVYTPFERATDEWVVMSDGSIAIIRGHDYHVDWIDPTSARRSTPKMSFTWVRITDEQKQRAITDNRTRVDEMNARYINPDTDTPVNGGRPRVFTFFVLPEFNDMPDYVAPFLHGAVIADPDNHIWLPPRTSNNVGVGVLYDVINNDGLVFERVRLPADRRLVGFTTRSTAILAHVVGTKTLLELARVR